MRELYWFQHDLRLQDNPALLEHASASELLLVYCWPDAPPWCNLKGIGGQRERFLRESLQSLRDELRAFGQDLLVCFEAPEQVLPRLVRQFRIERVGTALSPGYHERRARETLFHALQVPLQLHSGNTLFKERDLPFESGALPGQFTPFRERVEPRLAPQVVARPDTLPPPPAGVNFVLLEKAELPPHTALPLRGGAVEGQRRLQQWVFERQGIAQYKLTRNCLDPLDGSSTLSPWLANGCLSVREVAAAVIDYQQRVERNESTRWLLFELLWREFFHWRALGDDVSLFRAGGPRRRLTRCTFEPRNFARWCQGDTNFPLVNALMHQLVATGWMSNRGRQIAASCLVNEFGIDWRYGAAFFEKHLLDYDVASNYGNWQYLAGVGADPRGGRHFNQAKQAAEHDPDQLFTLKWDGVRPQQPEYVTDAADWPI